MEDSAEHRSQFSNPLFVWALIFSLALGFIRGIRGVLIYAYIYEILDIFSYTAVMTVIGFFAFPIISPLLILIKFYNIGRKIDPKISLALIARLTIVGNFIGYFTAQFLTHLIVPASPIDFLIGIVYELYVPFSIFFVEFTSFAIAYIKLLKSKTPQGIEPVQK